MDVCGGVYRDGRAGKMIKQRLKKLDKIDEIFENAEHQADAIVEIYKTVFPDWDAIEKINGWPSCGEDLALYICDKFIQFDTKHHPDVMAGGLWLNNGFSRNKKLKPWEIDMSTAKITYKAVLKAA